MDVNTYHNNGDKLKWAVKNHYWDDNKYNTIEQ